MLLKAVLLRPYPVKRGQQRGCVGRPGGEAFGPRVFAASFAEQSAVGHLPTAFNSSQVTGEEDGARSGGDTKPLRQPSRARTHGDTCGRPRSGVRGQPP